MVTRALAVLLAALAILVPAAGAPAQSSKAARTLGLTVPPSVLLTATHVIE